MSVKILHAADFHLDSAFSGFSSEQGRELRSEMRTSVEALSDYVNQNKIELVLLAGDLFDGSVTYRETIEQLLGALGRMSARVFIAPGNHDFYSAKSPYATLAWPENVHIFKSRSIECVELPELGCAVYGAAFADASQEESLLAGFRAPEDGLIHLMVLHGDVEGEAHYDPVRREEIAASGLDYLALGHTHAHRIERAGDTTYAYSGCLVGRGFDEPGDKGFLCGEVEKGKVSISFVPFARRRYQILTLTLTGRDAAAAMEEAFADHTYQNDICRVILTGETDERGIDCKALQERFAPQVFRLEVRDETHIARDIWERAEEDSLRGLFLRELRAQYEAAENEQARETVEKAVRFGLAALDRRDI